MFYRYSESTKKKAMWAFRVYTDWKEARNVKAVDDSTLSLITGELLEMSSVELNNILCRFVLEVRKKNAEFYPSDTLYELMISLQIYFHMHGRYVKFLDDQDFVELAQVLDNRMKYLASKGFSCPREKAEAIELDEEEQLWSSGTLGESNPKQLIDTLVYLMGVQFALRAGKEHKALRVGPRSQFKLKQDKSGDMYLEYTEDTSKNNQGGLKHRKIDKKVGRAYVNEAYPDRCLVRLYRKYLSLRPTSKNCSEDFYLRPLANPKDNTCWYSVQPMGINTLGSIVSSLARKIGLTGKITNHSCRASAASRMFQNNMEEQLVMDKTGHRSTAVRSYKRTSDAQFRDVTRVLYGQSRQECEATSAKTPKKSCPESAANVSQVAVNGNKNVTVASNTANVAQDNKESVANLSFNFTINVNK